ncbi:hypothetical protein MMC08_007984 [Hypocenomyce scalaris]|nr:hypothetical protein [Hypocenomyce scalaris]
MAMAGNVADSARQQQVIPEERATVNTYENPANYTQKFEKGEKVHLRVKVNSVWDAVYLTIGESKLGTDGKREYKLQGADGASYDGGKYFKEALLRAA